jgi:SAM-dependent methyltransferase
MPTLTPPSAALDGYAALAAHYDDFTAEYEYDNWIDGLERLALAHGLAGKRLLDVACGTGKSFMPFLARGYEVTACDLSPEMVAAAEAKVAGLGVELFVADMRELPWVGEFDLITCLDDSVNYLLEDDDLARALERIRRQLAPGGLVVFDCNTALTYRTAFRAQFVRESDAAFFAWRGEGSSEGGLATASIDVFARGEPGWVRRTSRHVQRHHTRRAVKAAAAAAGLRLVAARGQLPGGRLEAGPDESRHNKIVYVAGREEEVTA